jgi:hypothetical protein
MKTMKKILFFAAAITVMVGCTNDSFVGDGPDVNKTSKAIAFTSNLNTVTRADHVGADAAALLNNHFTVAGFKGAGDVTATVVATGTVFDNYVVNWAENTAATTESNTSDWEYVGITAVAPSTLAGNTQSIKYWDYSAAQYDFIAYSTGTATAITSGDPAAGEILVSAISAPNAKTAAYTLKGAAADLEKCYIADMVTAYQDGTDAAHKYQDEVTFKFRALASKVRVALYETIPGYSVKDVKFYTDATTTLAAGATSTDATLFTTATAAKDNFYTAGTYTVSFPTVGKANFSNSDYNKAHVSFVADATGKEATKTFDGLNYVAKQYKEKTGTQFLGRTLPTASYAGAVADNYYKIAMPNEEGTVLELRIDYTLESIDGSGEEIKVHGATAFVPAIYAAWKSNYAYTYVFKISDNTNGWTSTVDTDPAGLYPITFDAVVTETEDGVQETITTVATPSITTYAKGAIVTANDEYTAGSNIYVMVDGATLTTANSKLYTVELEAGAAQTINEASVANAIANGGASSPYIVTDANGKKLTVTDASGLSIVTEIAATDAPDGNAITINAAKFTGAAGTYAFEYNDGTAKHYKIIKVQ